MVRKSWASPSEQASVHLSFYISICGWHGCYTVRPISGKESWKACHLKKSMGFEMMIWDFFPNFCSIIGLYFGVGLCNYLGSINDKYSLAFLRFIMVVAFSFFFLVIPFIFGYFCYCALDQCTRNSLSAKCSSYQMLHLLLCSGKWFEIILL